MIFISSGLLGLIVFLVLWLGFGHLIFGVILGLIIAAMGPAITLGGGRRQ